VTSETSALIIAIVAHRRLLPLFVNSDLLSGIIDNCSTQLRWSIPAVPTLVVCRMLGPRIAREVAHDRSDSMHSLLCRRHLDFR
jgi:hypothetical protein